MVYTPGKTVGRVTAFTGELWTPAVLGYNVVQWWDGSDNAHMVFDLVTGKLSSWTNGITPGTLAATQTDDSRRPVVSGGEVRFDGAGIRLNQANSSRAYFEHTWFHMIFRINWTASGAGSDGGLFIFNGTVGNSTAPGGRQPHVQYLRTPQQVQITWPSSSVSGSSFVAHQLNVDIDGDDVWHSLISRRDLTGIYASLDGNPETFLACDATMPLLPFNQSPTGYIGDQNNSFLSWGLDTLLHGQGELSSDDIDKMHGWAMHRRDVEDNLPPGHPYELDPPTFVPGDIPVETPDSWQTDALNMLTVPWDTSTRGTALSLTGFVQTFSDHFTDIATTITDGSNGAGPWYAPARPDTSSAHFCSPLQTPSDIFTQYDATTLQIKHKFGIGWSSGSTNRWYSGHIQTVNSWGEGFTQAVPTGGSVYYEARIALSNTAGWPAFWLYSQNAYKDSAASHGEIDIIEAYGDNATSQKQLHIANHRHPAFRPQPGNAVDGVGNHTPSTIIDVTESPWSVSAGLFDGSGSTPGTFHTYGVMIDETWLTYFFDGLVTQRWPTNQEALLELYMLVSLQQQVAPVVPVDTYMWVDYVKAYIKT